MIGHDDHRLREQYECIYSHSHTGGTITHGYPLHGLLHIQRLARLRRCETGSFFPNCTNLRILCGGATKYLKTTTQKDNSTPTFEIQLTDIICLRWFAQFHMLELIQNLIPKKNVIF